jgi:hypothetical protein
MIAAASATIAALFTCVDMGSSRAAGGGLLSPLYCPYATASLVLGAVVSAASLASAPFSARDDAVTPRPFRPSSGRSRSAAGRRRLRNVVHVVYFKGESLHGDLFRNLDRTGALSRPVPVNSRPGSAVAAGTMRGAHIAIGRNDRCTSHGSGPIARGGRRKRHHAGALHSNVGRRATLRGRAQRASIHRFWTAVRSLPIALDGVRDVARRPTGMAGEAGRNVWITESHDDGQTFGRERLPPRRRPAHAGAAVWARWPTAQARCSCCIDRPHRKSIATRLLFSRDHGANVSNATPGMEHRRVPDEHVRAG